MKLWATAYSKARAGTQKKRRTPGTAGDSSKNRDISKTRDACNISDSKHKTPAIAGRSATSRTPVAAAATTKKPSQQGRRQDQDASKSRDAINSRLIRSGRETSSRGFLLRKFILNAEKLFSTNSRSVKSQGKTCDVTD